MADYREISHEYAHGGIKAALLVNGGAAVALLSQVADLAKPGISGNTASAMVVWAIGVLAAAAAWLFAFISTRYVDKSERETTKTEAHIKTSNIWMYVGLGSVVVSLLCFLVGSITLALGLGTLSQ